MYINMKLKNLVISNWTNDTTRIVSRGFRFISIRPGYATVDLPR
jgi:hypothetical protein